MEAALSTILDLEDSVAVVDAEDKVLAYGNWLGILQGTLTEEVAKGGKTFTRGLNADREYTGADGGEVTLHGRSLMFVRNVGHLMTNPAILYDGGKEIPEGILDAVVTTTIAMHDLKRKGQTGIRNSRTGSRLHRQAQDARPGRSGLRLRAVRPRRSSCWACPPTPSSWASWTRSAAPASTCKACIAEAAARVAFINTGFLDRTGDEMHTAMQAGPMIRKGDMKTSAWIQAYEKNNVLVGLSCGLRGRAQIGKGMWAMPDLMAAMLEQKIGHPQGRRQHRLGALAHRRHAARAALPPGERGRGAEGAGEDRRRRRARQHPGRPAAGAGRAPKPTGPRPSASRSWTTTCRASWATWCAGSTRAWAAPRCPTSTTSA